MPFISSAEELKRLEETKFYREAFSELMKMYHKENSFSLKRAVFLVENAWLENRLDNQAYENQIAAKIRELKLMMQKERISENDNLAKNHLIQQLFSREIVLNGKLYKPYQYDFDDFFGEKDWTKMFVSKLLTNSKGQCHSMPLLYLILAEQMNTKAWLSLAPEHSFVIFSDGKNFFNFETTSGKIVSSEWLMQSGYISSTAIRNRLYLDTLGKDGMMSTLIADLVMGYTGKFGYDNFMPQYYWEQAGNTQKSNSLIRIDFETSPSFLKHGSSWNANVIHLGGKGSRDGQYFHPAGNVTQSTGCFLACDYPVYKKNKFDGMEWATGTGGWGVQSKKRLADVRTVHNDALTFNNDPKLDFFVKFGAASSSTTPYSPRETETVEPLKPLPVQEMQTTKPELQNN